MESPTDHDRALHQSVALLRSLEVESGPRPEVTERLRTLVSVVQAGVQEGRLSVATDDTAPWPAITDTMSKEDLRVLAELLNSVTGAALREEHSTALAVRSALQRFEGDRGLLGEVLEVFLGQVPLQIQQMDQAAAAGDMGRITELAHELRGAAANVGAEALREVAYGLELDVKGDGQEGVPAQIEVLKVELARLRLAVEAFQAGGPRS